jgi:uncharacterized protein YndB with AHSA1/START domain
MTSDTLTFECTVNAPASQLYRAFTNSTALREWLCEAAMADPRPAGRLYLWWDTGYYASGEFTAVTPDEQIAFTWYGRNNPGPTQVVISLEKREEGTHVTLTHSGIGSGEEWAETVKRFERGWEVGLENLQSVLETGQDLRFVLRPMLGIMVGELNSEVADRTGVPVTEGIRLEDVIEGMGAAAAGLRQDDVIVGIGDVEVTGWYSMDNVLRTHRAGEQVDVVFYRGAEKLSVAMDLSGRPLPEVPATPVAFAEAIHEHHAAVDGELEAFLEGVTEEEASFRPAPDEWTVKEILAHLIASTRGWHSFLIDMINDDEPWYDRWESHTNVPARNKAILAAYPTIPELLGEFKRNRTETVEILAALPPEFIARKGSYVKLGYWMLETPGYHVRQHLEQARMAVEAARKSS